MEKKKILSEKDLVIHYETENAVVEAVNGVSFDILESEAVGLVGETGAGKTTTALGIMRLIQSPPGRIIDGEIIFEGEDLIKKSEHAMRKIRGNSISMIFQDPMTSLNPVIPVGDQISEVIRLHYKLSRQEAALKAQKMLEMVGITKQRYSDYPHQFSGGMKQRVVIAMALACNPKLLIADEPTTALDVTIQAQVLERIRELQKEYNTSMLLITHDLGVVAETCDKVGIIYAGEIVEFGPLRDVFKNSLHPYTKGLFGSLPSVDRKMRRLHPIKGLMPDPSALPEYCSFYDRCDYASEKCRKHESGTVEVTPGHFVKCMQYQKEDN